MGMPNFHETGLLFWTGFVLLCIVAVIYLYKGWMDRAYRYASDEREVRPFDKIIRYFLGILIVTLCFIAGVICLTMSQGKPASAENIMLNSSQSTRDDFAESADKELQETKPTTSAEMREQRAAKEEQQKKEAIENRQRLSEEVGATVNGFREKILNRDNPPNPDAKTSEQKE
jgi:hypothetical protein